MVGTDETRETSKGEQPKRYTVETKGARGEERKELNRGVGGH